MKLPLPTKLPTSDEAAQDVRCEVRADLNDGDGGGDDVMQWTTEYYIDNDDVCL